jgi:hypothetical protein
LVTVYYNPGMEHHVSKFLDMTGLERYETNRDWQQPAIWMSLYNYKDYLAFKFHEGPKLVYWFGSDVTALVETGLVWTSHNWVATSEDLVKLVKSKDCIHVCQNELLQSELASVGIDSIVRPLYLGDLDSFETCFKSSKKPSVYSIVSAGRPTFYGLDWIYEVANKTEVEFHIYGHKGQDTHNVFHHYTVFEEPAWHPNEAGEYEVITKIKGLPEQEFNEKIQAHQAFLRLPEHDGVSQTVMRALAMGQYVCDRINYPFVHHVTSPDDVLEFVNGLHLKTEPNQDIAVLNEVVNNFDWLEDFLEANPVERDDEWSDSDALWM